MRGMIIFLSVLFAAQVHASGRCGPSELQAIEGHLDKVQGVSALHQSYKQIQKCNAMTGGIAEGFDDIANKLLANHLPEVLSSPSLKDKPFKKALLGSISEGTEAKAFRQIYDSAKTCSESNAFCKEVVTRCNEAEEIAKRIRDQHK